MKRTIVVFLVFLASAHAKLPSYIEPCSRKSNLTSCILSNIETFRPYLDDGIPDLSLPPFAPYFNPKIAVSKDSYTLEVVNVTYRSFEKFQVRHLDLNLDAPSLDVEIWFPDLMCWGIYTLLGNMAGQTFNSSGIFFAKAGTFVVREKMQGIYHEVKGKRYLQLKGESFDYEMRNGFGYIENVYPGDPMKSLLFNVELNDHFVEFFKNVDPFMQNGYEQEIVRAFTGVFGRYPIEELFP